jgi:hypothetical protein
MRGDDRATRIARLLDDGAYHIELHGHLTNHAKHAVVALDRLGASAAWVETYVARYAHRTPHGYGLEPARPATTRMTEDDWEAWLGRRHDYEAYTGSSRRGSRRVASRARSPATPRGSRRAARAPCSTG